MNKTILLLTVILSISVPCMAQKIEIPQYPNGDKELNNYLKNQLEKMRTASMKDIDGGVNILFEVDSEGRIQNPIVGLSLNPKCDSLALKIVREMPRWIPGKKDQKPTLMYTSVRVVFGKDVARKETGLVGIASDRSQTLKNGLTNSLPPSSNSDAEGVDDIESEGEVFVMSDIDIEESTDSIDWDNQSPIQVSIHDVEERGIDIQQLENPDDVVNKPFSVVEQMPVYPGGEKEMDKFIKENLRYPVVAQEEEIQGRVVVRFVVEKDGTVSNVNILRGIDSACDKEAVRLVKSFQKWIPGKQNGEAVRVYYTIPIKFYLND